MNERPQSRGFRPSRPNAERLAYAESIGIPYGRAINEILERYFKDYVDEKKADMRKALAKPLPQ